MYRYHLRAPKNLLVWNGREEPPLYSAEPRDFQSFMFPYRENPAENLVLKIGSECLVDRRWKRTHYSVERYAEEVAEARRRGKRVVVVHSSTCKLGRMERRRNRERIGSDELDERRRDAELGKNHARSLIRKYFGESGVLLYVTPDVFLNEDKRKDFIDDCIWNMSKGRDVWVNEDDERCTKEEYDTTHGTYKDTLGTFKDNDGLASLIAVDINKVNGPTWLVYYMDQMGILPKDYILDAVRGETRTALTTIDRLDQVRRRDDFGNIIGIVRDPSGLDSQTVVDDAPKSSDIRISRGGVLSKILAADYASRNDVPVWLLAGMFRMHDYRHMQDRRQPRTLTPISAVLDLYHTGTNFLPRWHHLYSQDL
jgi:glutamate 5-kinase